jgi:hypothetical protein
MSNISGSAMASEDSATASTAADGLGGECLNREFLTDGTCLQEVGQVLQCGYHVHLGYCNFECRSKPEARLAARIRPSCSRRVVHVTLL